MNIQQTKDYSRFFIREDNREINQAHLKKLIKSIQSKDLMAYNPIIINRGGEIIDGQHRYEAAKKLEKTIYYVVMDNGALQDIILLNNNMRNWTTTDFMMAYIRLGNQNYRQLQQFSKDYNMTIPTSLHLLSGTTGINHEDFRLGKFTVRSYEKGVQMAKFIQALGPYTEERFLNTKEFIRSILQLYGKIDSKEVLSQLDKHKLPFKKQPNLKGYLRQFEDIINFRKRNNFSRLY
jgi:hypothetical protein